MLSDELEGLARHLCGLYAAGAMLQSRGAYFLAADLDALAEDARALERHVVPHAARVALSELVVDDKVVPLFAAGDCPCDMDPAA